jgi:4-hydroxy-tetrahydrodipicolinate synthase
MLISSNTKFEGVFTALITPFKNNQIDYESLDRLLDQQLAGGVAGVVPCGTTGESPTLSHDEKQRLIKTTVSKCKNKILVIAGTGSNDTTQTIASTKEAEGLGVDAALVVVPYYNKPSQEGLYQHFKAVADSVKIPIILYNVPGRTQISLTAETVARLAEIENIVGIKEASGQLHLLTEIRHALTKRGIKRFTLLSGDDPTLWPFLWAGGHGVISVASNVNPKAVVNLVAAAETDPRQGCIWNDQLIVYFNILFCEANPVPVKALMAKLHSWSADVRLPLFEMNPANFEKLFAAYQSLPTELQQ